MYHPETEKWLRDNGYDPDKVIIDPETREIIEKPVVVPPATSALAAGARHGAAGLIPAAAGTAGAGLGSLAAAALAPETAGASLLLPLIFGAGSAAGASALQEKIMPDDWKAQLVKDVEEHPVASAVGGAASQLPFMRPSLNTVRQAGAGLRGLVSAGGLNQVKAEQINALKNIAAGGAIGGGMEAGREIIHSDKAGLDKLSDLSPSEIAKAVGEGLLFHEPTAIGRKVSFNQFHQTPEYRPDEFERIAGKEDQLSAATVAAQQEAAFKERFKPLRYALEAHDVPFENTVGGLKKVMADLTKLHDPKDLAIELNKAKASEAEYASLADRWEKLDPAQGEKWRKLSNDAKSRKAFLEKVPDVLSALDSNLTSTAPTDELAAKAKTAEQQRLEKAKLAEWLKTTHTGPSPEEKLAADIEEQRRFEAATKAQEQRTAEMLGEAEATRREMAARYEKSPESITMQLKAERDARIAEMERFRKQQQDALAANEVDKARQLGLRIEGERAKLAALEKGEAAAQLARETAAGEAEARRRAYLEGLQKEELHPSNATIEAQKAHDKAAFKAAADITERQRQEREALRSAKAKEESKWATTQGARFQPAEGPGRVVGSNWDEALGKVGNRFGADVQYKDKVITPEGKEVNAAAGKLANPTDRALIQIGNRAGLDAAPHELWHTIADRFKNGSSSERRFIERSVKAAVEAHPDVAEATAQRLYGKSLDQLTKNELWEVGHEVSTQKIGEHLVSRVRGDDSWFKDVGAFLSNKLGIASDKQLTRLASNLIRRGKGFDVVEKGPDAGQRYQQLTPEFQSWNKDSALVDKDGQPIKLYHGTNKEFTKFAQSKEGEFGNGIYLTTDPERASRYAMQTPEGEGKSGGNAVMQLYSNIKNPLIVDATTDKTPPAVLALQQLGLSREKASSIFEKALESKGNLTKQLSTKLQAAGYDGLVVKRSNGDLEVVVYDPRNVKSATGNKGAFDPANADVRYQPLSEQTKSKEFKTFFGDWERIQELNKLQQENFSQERQKEIYRLLKNRSAVVDDEGNPKVFYHGTKRAGFTVFDNDRTPEMGMHFGTPDQSNEFVVSSRPGYHKVFNDEKSIYYNPDRSDALYPVYLNIKKPLVTPDVYSADPSAFVLWARKNKIVDPETLRRAEAQYRGSSVAEAWNTIKRGLIEKGYDGIQYHNIHEGNPGDPSNVAYIAFHPEQVKSAIGNKGTFDPANPDIRYQPLGPSETPEHKARNFNIFASPIESLAKRDSFLADAFDRLFNKERSYQGFTNKLLEPLFGLPKEDRIKAWEVMHDEKRLGEKVNTTPEIRQAVDEIRAALVQMHENQRAAGHTNVEGEEVKDDPFYAPAVLSSEARQILSEHQNTPAYNRLKQDFLEHQTAAGKSIDEANEMFDRYTTGVTGAKDINKEFSFKAVDLPAGVDLPASWIEADPETALRKYGQKFAKARAWWDVFQSNPEAMGKLGYKKFKRDEDIEGQFTNFAADPAVKDLLAGYANNIRQSSEPLIPSIGRFVNSLFLAGPVTKATDVATSLFKGLAYAPTGQELKLIGHVFSNWKQSIEHSFNSGLNRRGDSIVMHDVLGAGEYASRSLDKATEHIVKWTGTEKLEQVSRGLSQGIGEFVGEAQKSLALEGNEKAMAFLDKLGSDWRDISTEELGARVGQLLQGRYNVSNSARWLYDSPLAPFFGMMRWSTEQFNNFNKFAVQPALKGDPGPLMKQVVIGLGGGLLLNELRDALASRKSQDASWKEISVGKNQAAEVTAKLVGAMQVASTAGIISEFIKQGMDIVRGQLPQGFHYPLASSFADTATRIQGAIDGIRAGEDVSKIIVQLSKDVLRGNIQVARLALDHYDRLRNDPSIAEKDARRDLRVFNRLNDYPAGAGAPLVPSYSNLTEKELDRTQDMGEAVRLSRDLVKRAFDRYAESKDLVELRSTLRKIKTAPEQFIPVPSRDPAKFVKYLNYVRQTQGEAAAEKVLREYGLRAAYRAAKTSAVPSL